MFWLISIAAAQSPPDSFLTAIRQMQAAVAEVHDATFVLHQQEYVGGRLGAPVTMHVRYRSPNTVYVEWDNGQRLLWDPTKGTKMWVDPGPYLPALWLSPDSMFATRGQRHTVRRMGFAPVVDLFAPDIARIQADPRLEPTVTTAASTLFGRAAQCFDATMRKDLEPALYAERVEVCLDASTWLPLRMRVWDTEDGQRRMVEEYGYEAIQVNVGLPDATFDPRASDL